MTDFYVYLYTDPIRNVPIYVGKGRGNRAFLHLRRKDPCKFVNRLRKLKKEGVEPVITFLYTHLTEGLALLAEKIAITKYGRKDLGLGTLYNLTDGGEGTSNPSAETRELLSKANKGKPKSEVTRKRMSEGRIGIVFSDEHRANIGAKLEGKPWSEARRAVQRTTWSDARREAYNRSKK